MRLPALAVAVALTATLGAACSSDDDDGTVGAGPSSTEAPADDSSAAGEHNDADVAFAQMMIPHHTQAVAMADLVPDRSENEAVLDLAERIKAAQAPEIDQMRGWLADWGEEVDDPTMGEMDMGGSGMMTEEQMGELEAASGTEFDVAFLEMMTEHHEGAVEMAETEIADGEFAEAIELARAIVAAQEAEIAEMETILADIEP